MDKLKNSSLVDTAWGRKSTHVPVWLMRQAGRYLPAYRKVREKYDFLTMIHEPELVAEITLQPLREFPLDAAILFSDILVIPEAAGTGLGFSESGPYLEKPLKVQENMKGFLEMPPDVVKERLDYVYRGIRHTKDALNADVPLIGFAGSPFTLFVYMMEGSSSKTWSSVKTMMYHNPAMVHAALDKITDMVTIYLREKIQAGVDAVQIFDSWAGILSVPAYFEFSWVYMEKIIRNLEKENIPVFAFLRNFHSNLDKIAQSGANVISLDWGIDLKDARSVMGERITLQGNLDPGILYGSASEISLSATHILQNAGERHIFNLGHGIYPDTPVDAVKVLVDTVHHFTRS